MTFATQLRTIRTARGLTQKQLELETGIPNTMLSLMESGKVIPTGDWADALRKALDWTPATDDALATLTQDGPEPEID